MKKPAIGRIVIFTLSAQCAEQINRRRTTTVSIADRAKEGNWPTGAMAHIGNAVKEGDKFPMIITAVWSDTCVNGKAFLDGSDDFWVTSAVQGDGKRQWEWPEINETAETINIAAKDTEVKEN